MSSPDTTQDQGSRYYVVKHSWRGKYKRMFVIGKNEVATINPSSGWDITNSWKYGEQFFDIMPSSKNDSEFNISVTKGSKATSMSFSTPHRARLLTDVGQHRQQFSRKAYKEASFNAYKMRWSDTKVPTILVATPIALCQRSSTSPGITTAQYLYCDIAGLAYVDDVPGGIVVQMVGQRKRTHWFVSDERDSIARTAFDMAKNYIGVTLAKLPSLRFSDFAASRLGPYSDEEALLCPNEFRLTKLSPRHLDGVNRILGISEICIVERDVATYSVVTTRPLSEVNCLIRCEDDVQKFGIEYKDETRRYYICPSRDALLASLLEAVRSSNNCSACVRMTETPRHLRAGPFTHPVDEEIESMLLKSLSEKSIGDTQEADFMTIVAQFNANIEYGGLRYAETQDSYFAENKEKLISNAIQGLLSRDRRHKKTTPNAAMEQLQALRRLAASKAGFDAFTTLDGFNRMVARMVAWALELGNDGATYTAMDLLGSLMRPMHDNYEILKEQMNKRLVLSSPEFVKSLIELMRVHVDKDTGALVVSAILDFLMFVLVPPFCDTTTPDLYDMVLTSLFEGASRQLFKLFRHPSIALVKGAGLLTKAIVEEGEEEMVQQLQRMALTEGAMLWQLYNSIFMTGDKNTTTRELARHLVGIWTVGNHAVFDLLQRMLPAGLLTYLVSKEDAPGEAGVGTSKKAKRRKCDFLAHWGAHMYTPSAKQPLQPVVLRKQKQQVKSAANWPLFFYQITQDHTRADLIWNHHTREELREACETEMRLLGQAKDLNPNSLVVWNHVEFEVVYPSLASEIRIGTHYLRLLLEEDKPKIFEPARFFNELYHKFLLASTPQMRLSCLQGLSIVYKNYFNEVGAFNDVHHLIYLLNKTIDRGDRDRILLFLQTLMLYKANIKLLLDANGVQALIDLATLSHFHTERAQTPLHSNVIEAGPNIKSDSEKEWYYQEGEDRRGPVGMNEMKELYANETINANSKCWAQGMEGWTKLRDIPQLKWPLCSTGVQVLNPTELATLLLQMFHQMCEFFPSRDENAIIHPLPRIKRALGEPQHLRHLVQLLLTLDPSMVENVTHLLHKVLQDSPALPQLYTTGFFYFALMYTGSNIMPLCKIFHISHNLQSFRAEEVTDSNKRSILHSILPEAMIAVLDHHGPEKFAEIFLGEFDTPEAIWNNEMRRHMIEKIALHLAEFTPRLMSNPKVLYLFHPIPKIFYPRLDHELFCNIYFLRNLCDEQRFPNWPIRNHIELLKDVLVSWKDELNKSPSGLKLEECYAILRLKSDEEPTEQQIRRAYFKVATKFHPDKNPDPSAREVFEKAAKAYEFLTSPQVRASQAPEPKNLYLLIKTQSILYSRYTEILSPFKYAGYGMLVNMLKQEFNDPNLFSKELPLLPSLTELAYYTVNSSALNAEELRREGGLVILDECLDRCCSLLTQKMEEDYMPLNVCIHTIHCFGASANFQECRDAIATMPRVITNIALCLTMKGFPNLVKAAVQAMYNFGLGPQTQELVYRSGALWSLMLLTFNYDYTLDESGVEKKADSNIQEVSNSLAKLSVLSLARLAGLMPPPDNTPPHLDFQRSLCGLLTVWLAKQLGTSSPETVLRYITNNYETPYFLWTNGTRAELQDYLERQRDASLRREVDDPSMGTTFINNCASHRDEFIVGGVFIRIYNEQPTFPLEDPKDFIMYSLSYIQSAQLKTYEVGSLQHKRAIELLKAMINAINSNPTLETSCIDYFPLLFQLLDVKNEVLLSQALQLLIILTINKDCVNKIGEDHLLTSLLIAVNDFPKLQELALKLLQPLAACSKIVLELHNKGIVLHLLLMIGAFENSKNRELAAGVYSKLVGEKLNGPKLALRMSQFLPPIFTDTMRENPQSAISMFDHSHENPELIWDDTTRDKVLNVARELKDRLIEQQRQDPEVVWRLPDNFEPVYSELQNEVCVGGVFLRLFTKQPGWALRNPKQFCASLLDVWIRTTNAEPLDTARLQLLTDSVLCLLRAQATSVEHVAQLGHVSKILDVASLCKPFSTLSALSILQLLTPSSYVLENLGGSDPVMPMIKILNDMPEHTLLAADCLHKMMANDTSRAGLMGIAIKVDLVGSLLKILERGIDSRCEKPGPAKALIVSCIKVIANDPNYGPRVQTQLSQCSAWGAYRDQRHDLFITGDTVAAITGGTATTGLLTAPSSKRMNASEPPPV